MWRDLGGEESSNTSSSIPSSMGFILEEVLVPGDFSKDLKKYIYDTGINNTFSIYNSNCIFADRHSGMKSAITVVQQPTQVVTGHKPVEQTIHTRGGYCQMCVPKPHTHTR